MKETINNTAQLLNSPMRGRGAKRYFEPRIEIIFLDSDISLALESTAPPEGPGETGSLSPEFLHNEPFKSQLV